MPGLVPGIHVFPQKEEFVDGWDKPGHDAARVTAFWRSPPMRADTCRYGLPPDSVSAFIFATQAPTRAALTPKSALP